MKLCVYEIATGRVRFNVDCPDDHAEAQTRDHDDLDYLVVTADVNGNTHYVRGDRIVPRPVLAFDRLEIAADGVDRAVLALREPFRVTVEGTKFQVDDPDGDGAYALVLVSTMPAVYRVGIDHWPYLPFQAEITTL
jgi:hypothetical protein